MMPWDGKSLGEVVASGDTVAQGYFNNAIATERHLMQAGFIAAMLRSYTLKVIWRLKIESRI